MPSYRRAENSPKNLSSRQAAYNIMAATGDTTGVRANINTASHQLPEYATIQSKHLKAAPTMSHSSPAKRQNILGRTSPRAQILLLLCQRQRQDCPFSNTTVSGVYKNQVKWF
ncbi:hypothetical protein BGZ92_009107 [Podila epicladia]|nr:hypothetical protein BGZ92_009107 [Podila epicladia]